MDEIVLLTNLAMFLLLAAVCSIIFNKIKLPPLVGYLLAGIIIANLWLTDESSDLVVSILSNMGLIILMFCLGLEINLKKIRKQGLFAMEVAMVQLPLMVLGGILAGRFMGFDSLQSICLGAIISGSSTAVVLAVMNSHNLLDSDHKATLILVLIMEDIGQVIMLSVLTPMMAGLDMDSGALAAMVVSIAVFMAVSIIVGVRMMPRVINWLSDNVSSEVLVITAVGLSFGMALLAHYAGLSVAIGAFLMGMMISSSRKSKEILNEIEPMKNIFMAMFFISVGMEVSLTVLAENVLLIIEIYLTFAILIISSVFLGYWMGNENPRIGFISAISLTTMGEFAFIISKQALDYGVVSDSFYSSVVGAAILSMLILPVLAKNSDRIWRVLSTKTPSPILNALISIDAKKTSVYNRIESSSKKTRKEFDYILSHIYLYAVLVVIIEIFFITSTLALSEWAATYFGGDKGIWGFVFLMVNVLVAYIPISRMIMNIKLISTLGHPSRRYTSTESRFSLFMDAFLRSNTSLLSLIIAIVIIIITPNGVELWQHIVVMMIALIVLFLYNKRSLQNIRVLEQYEDDPEESDMDTESFRKLIDEKMSQRDVDGGRLLPSGDNDDTHRLN